MSALDLNETDVIHLCVVLRMHKRNMIRMQGPTHTTDAVLAKIFAAFPEINLANPKKPVL